MSEEIKCHECGHSINEHYAGVVIFGCLFDDNGDGCECNLNPSDIAAYHIVQAYEQARIDYGVGNVDRFLSHIDLALVGPSHKAVAESS